MKHLFSLGAAILIAAQFITSCSSVPDSVLARVGNDTLRAPDYEAMFLRTRFTPPTTLEEREAFLDTYLNYKLKLQEAETEGIDARPEFIADFQRYRDQLALTFLYQQEIVTPGMHILYDRRLEEVELQQIVVKYLKYEDGENDTTATRAKAEEILAKVRKSDAPFDSLVARYSDDGSKERTRGVLGWFIAGTTYPELDDMMYAAAPGDIAPQLLKTVFGYHIFRLLNRKPARQRLHAAHILCRLDLDNPNDTAAAFAAQSSLLDSLRMGVATFEELARRYSQDSLSGAQGGDLGWLNRGTTIEPRFEEALFGLKVGEVSGVVRTAFGMHIIKVLDEEPALPFEEQKDHLRSVYNNERFQTDLTNYLAWLRKKYDFTVNRNVVNLLLSRLDSTVTTSTPAWERKLLSQDLDANLFQLSLGSVTVGEVIQFSKPEVSIQMRRITAGLLDTLSVMAANRIVALNETKGFDEKIPEFHRLLKEYRESSMITTLEDQVVWGKLENDEPAMKAWFEQNRDLFRYPERVQIAEIFTYSKPYADEYLDSLAAGTDFLDLASRRTQRAGYFSRKGVWDYIPTDGNSLAGKTERMKIGEIRGPFGYEEGFSLIKLLDRQPARLKTWEEARAEIVPEFKEKQAEDLRAEWLRGLREKFGVEIWNDHVAKTFSPKEAESKK
ncbi:MAG: peptidylprolyl isomerase [Bacteroidota bacterium]